MSKIVVLIFTIILSLPSVWAGSASCTDLKDQLVAAQMNIQTGDSIPLCSELEEQCNIQDGAFSTIDTPICCSGDKCNKDVLELKYENALAELTLLDGIKTLSDSLSGNHKKLKSINEKTIAKGKEAYGLFDTSLKVANVLQMSFDEHSSKDARNFWTDFQNNISNDNSIEEYLNSDLVKGDSDYKKIRDTINDPKNAKQKKDTLAAMNTFYKLAKNDLKASNIYDQMKSFKRYHGHLNIVIEGKDKQKISEYAKEDNIDYKNIKLLGEALLSDQDGSTILTQSKQLKTLTTGFQASNAKNEQEANFFGNFFADRLQGFRDLGDEYSGINQVRNNFSGLKTNLDKKLKEKSNLINHYAKKIGLDPNQVSDLSGTSDPTGQKGFIAKIHDATKEMDEMQLRVDSAENCMKKNNIQTIQDCLIAALGDGSDYAQKRNKLMQLQVKLENLKKVELGDDKYLKDIKSFQSKYCGENKPYKNIDNMSAFNNFKLFTIREMKKKKCIKNESSTNIAKFHCDNNHKFPREEAFYSTSKDMADIIFSLEKDNNPDIVDKIKIKTDAYKAKRAALLLECDKKSNFAVESICLDLENERDEDNKRARAKARGPKTIIIPKIYADDKVDVDEEYRTPGLGAMNGAVGLISGLGTTFMQGWPKIQQQKARNKAFMNYYTQQNEQAQWWDENKQDIADQWNANLQNQNPYWYPGNYWNSWGYNFDLTDPAGSTTPQNKINVIDFQWAPTFDGGATTATSNDTPVSPTNYSFGFNEG